MIRVKWDALLVEFIRDDKPLWDFLRSKGLNPTGGGTWRHTRGWPQKRIEFRNGVKLEEYAELIKRVEAEVGPIVNRPDPPRITRAFVPREEPTVDRLQAMAETGRGAPAATVSPEALPATWQVIEQLRAKQALEDYRTAEAIRAHLKLRLREAHTKGPDGIPRTALRAMDVRALALAALDVQKIQRLALGLSTENVGVDGPTQGTHVEKGAEPTIDAEVSEKPLPIYVVEMSRRGRFVRPKPRRVS